MLVLSPLRCRRHLNGDNGHEGLENDGHFTHFSDYFFHNLLLWTKWKPRLPTIGFILRKRRKNGTMPFVCFRIHDCAAKLPFVCIRKPHRPPRGCALPFWLTYSIYSFLFNYGVSASRPAQIPKDLGTKHEMLCIGGSRGRLPNTFLISPVYLCYKKHSFVYLQFHYRFDPCFL